MGTPLRARRLEPGFFRRSTLRAARDLIGMLLIHRESGGTTGGTIVETEAYTGADDPGSHACRGLKRRNAPMFGPPGRAYVYKCHLYPLLNVVTSPKDVPGAVLLRAIEPEIGVPLMSRRRGGPRLEHVASGPGKLCQALGVGLRHNRSDLLRGPLFLARPARPRKFRVLRSVRIGLKGEASLLPRRFFAEDSQFVSRFPGNPPRV